MNINGAQATPLLNDEYMEGLHANVNKDIVDQKKKINYIKKITISNLVILSILLIVIILMTIEYNIILHNFNGFGGMADFINKTTVLVNKLTPIINDINQTEAHMYLNDVMYLINQACQTVDCP